MNDDWRDQWTPERLMQVFGTPMSGVPQQSVMRRPVESRVCETCEKPFNTYQASRRNCQSCEQDGHYSQRLLEYQRMAW